MSNIGTQLRGGIRAAAGLQGRWAAMLLLTVVATITALPTTPFIAAEGEFFHALRSGEVTSVAVGNSADFSDASIFRRSTSQSRDDIVVSWVNRLGLRRQAVLNELNDIDDQGSRGGPDSSGSPDTAGDGDTDFDRSAHAVDTAATILKTAGSLGAVPPAIVQPGDLPFDNLRWLSVLATILMIGVVITGPQPRRMTKWGAFWVCLVPFNAGSLYLLLRESPWNPRMNLLPEPGPRVLGVMVDPVTEQDDPSPRRLDHVLSVRRAGQLRALPGFQRSRVGASRIRRSCRAERGALTR